MSSPEKKYTFTAVNQNSPIWELSRGPFTFILQSEDLSSLARVRMYINLSGEYGVSNLPSFAEGDTKSYLDTGWSFLTTYSPTFLGVNVRNFNINGSGFINFFCNVFVDDINLYVLQK